MFPLALFPEGALQGSVLITVFIGILVIAAFSETLGWSFTGLVVPGYLAPILLLAPEAAGLIAIEAVFTYLLVYLFSERFSRYGHWAPLTGRERFICFFLVSIIVRLAAETIATPLLTPLLSAWIPALKDHQGQSAIGLVIVPLMANMFWRPGLFRGLGQAFILSGITFLIIYLVFIPYTNFSLSSLNSLYEAAAIDLAASPKILILLLTGAIIAAHVQETLGWRTGVLIPGLLAIGFFFPGSLAATLLELVFLICITNLILRLPYFRQNIPTGPRLFCLICSLAFIQKMMLGHLFSQAWPSLPYENLMGYGYIITSLLTKRAIEEHSIAPVLGPITVTSFASFFLGSILGWSTIWAVPSTPTLWQTTESSIQQQEPDIINISIFDLITQDQARFPRLGATRPTRQMYSYEAQSFQNLIQLLSHSTAKKEKNKSFVRAHQLASRLGLELLIVNDSKRDARFAYLREPPEKKLKNGFGIYAFRIDADNQLLLEVPRPVSEAHTLEAASVLMELTSAHVLIAPGAHFQTNSDGTSDALKRSRTPFRLAHDTLRQHEILEIRKHEDESKSILWVEGDLPEMIRLKEMERWLGQFDLTITPTPPPVRNDVLRKPRRKTFCTLALAPTSARNLIAARFVSTTSLVAPQSPSIVSGHINTYLNTILQAAPPERTRATLPSPSELLYFDQQIFTPLLTIAEEFKQPSRQSPEESSKNLNVLLKSMRPIVHSAFRLDYSLDLVRQLSGDTFAILSPNNETREHQHPISTFVFRFGKAQKIHILAPDPTEEKEACFAASELFVSLQARALFLGPRRTATRGISQAQHQVPLETFYHLAHQIIQRRAWKKQPILSLECRGASHWPSTIKSDAMLREGTQPGGAQALSTLTKRTLKALNQGIIKTQVHAGTAFEADFDSSLNPELLFNESHGGGPFATLWISPAALKRFTPPNLSARETALFQALNIVTVHLPLNRWLERKASQNLPTLPFSDPWKLFSKPAEQAMNYSQERNIVYLQSLREECRKKHIELTLIIEPERGLPILAMEANLFPNRTIRLLINLRPLTSGILNGNESAPKESVEKLLRHRPAGLIFGARSPREKLKQ